MKHKTKDLGSKTERSNGHGHSVTRFTLNRIFSPFDSPVSMELTKLDRLLWTMIHHIT